MNIYKGIYFIKNIMIKELQILKIKKDKRCDWEEAKKEMEKRKTLSEFF